MKVLSTIKKSITKADFFYSTQMIRYKGDQQFKNFFGGLTSIVIFATLMAAFFNKISSVLNKSQIVSIASRDYGQNSIRLSNNKKGDKNLMFAVQLDPGIYNYIFQHQYNKITGQWGYYPSIKTSYNYDAYYTQYHISSYFETVTENITTNTSFFNTTTNITQNITTTVPTTTVVKRILNISQTVNLQLCTRQHWNNYPQIQLTLTDQRLQNLFCPPLNYTFQLLGKQTSDNYSYIQINIDRCSQNYSSPTSSKSIYNQNLDCTSFYPVSATLLYPNPIINPNSKNYLINNLINDNTVQFKGEYYSSSFYKNTIQVEEYNIKTDQSILPVESSKIQSGAIVNKPVKKQQFATNYFLEINLRSTLYKFALISTNLFNNYDRSYKKLDEVISYIGGLFGTVISCFFLFNTYHSYAYQANIGSKLFDKKTEQAKIIKNYNVLSFFKHYAYETLSSFKCKPKWKDASLYEEFQTEMLKQLDILYILQRLNFFEKSISLLFSQGQIRGLHLQSKGSFYDAKKNRQKYNSKIRLKKQLQKKQDLPRINNANLNKQSQFKGESMKAEGQFKNSICQIKNDEISEKTGYKIANNAVEQILSNLNQSINSQQSQNQQNKSQIQQLHCLIQQVKRGQQISVKIWQGLDKDLKKQLQSNYYGTIILNQFLLPMKNNNEPSILQNEFQMNDGINRSNIRLNAFSPTKQKEGMDRQNGNAFLFNSQNIKNIGFNNTERQNLQKIQR